MGFCGARRIIGGEQRIRAEVAEERLKKHASGVVLLSGEQRPED